MTDIIFGMGLDLESENHFRLEMSKALSTYYAICPVGLNNKPCSGRGFCDFSSQQCQCDEGFSGPSCAELKCRVDARGNVCGGHGTCNLETGTCECSKEWRLEVSSGLCTRDCRSVKESGSFGYLFIEDKCVEYCSKRDNQDCGSISANLACKALGYARVVDGSESVAYETRTGSDSTYKCSTVMLGESRVDKRYGGPFKCGFMWTKECCPTVFSWIRCERCD